MSVDQKNGLGAATGTVQPSDDIENLYRALQCSDAPDLYPYQEVKQRESLKEIYRRWPLLSELVRQKGAEESEVLRER